MQIETPANLPDSELLVRVKELVQCECRATSALVAQLAEIETRRLYLAEGYPSLFSYCTQVLHLSEHAAYNRIEAAKAAIRFPVVLEFLDRGDVHLTAVKLLAPLLTIENHRDLLAAATHKSKREIEAIVARVRPQPDVPDAVRKVPVSRTNEAVAVSNPESSTAAVTAQLAATQPAATQPAAAPARPAVVVAIAPERYKVQFTASAATYEKLRRARALLGHQVPDGDLAEVFDRALTVLVRDLEKKKLAAAERPRSGGPAANRRSRHIPAAVKRAVWQRDQGRCTFVSPGGKRCNEEGQLEFDHIQPHGDGGHATRDNVRLLCARHNRFLAREFYGPWPAGVVPDRRHDAQSNCQDDFVRESNAAYGRHAVRLVPGRAGDCHRHVWLIPARAARIAKFSLRGGKYARQ